MEIKDRIENDICIIEIEGNIALEVTSEIRDELRPFVERSDIKGIVFNLAKVKFIDSSGIGLIVSIYKNLKQKDKKMALSNLNEKNREIFSLTRLDQILTIVDNEDEATKIFQ